MTAHQHGIKSTYTNWGCRCDECTAAHTRDEAKARKARYDWTREHGLPAGVKHGASAYSNWGCRCTVCTGAKESIARRRRLQQ